MNGPPHSSFIALVVSLACAAPSSAAVITVFPGTDFNSNEATMNATLGITGFTIEDFEDATLLPGLTFTAGGSTIVTVPLSSTLAWDGSNVLSAYFPNGNTEVTFNFDSSSSFGIGISDEEGWRNGAGVTAGDFLVSVNSGAEVNLHTFSNYLQVDNSRNAYIRIDADGSDPTITSVRFRSAALNDGIQYDHLALNVNATPIPEPNSLLLIGLGTGLFALHHRRRRKRTEIV